MTHTVVLPSSLAHLTQLRLNDLVAKVAKVTLKDTTRVLMSLELVSSFVGVEAGDILALDFDVTKPTADEANACTDAYEELTAYVYEQEGADWLKRIRSVD
jgi:hypothetical protein